MDITTTILLTIICLTTIALSVFGAWYGAQKPFEQVQNHLRNMDNRIDVISQNLEKTEARIKDIDGSIFNYFQDTESFILNDDKVRLTQEGSSQWFAARIQKIMHPQAHK